MWKKVLREYFSFSRKERRGIWFLWILLTLLLCWHIINHHFFSEENLINYKIITFNELKRIDSVKQQAQWFAQKKRSIKQRKLYFNYADEKTLIDVGISPKHAKMLIDKIANGIKVYTVDDLEKLDLKDSTLIKQLKSSLSFFPSKKYFQTDYKKYQAQTSIEKININLTDSNALEQLKGIGMGTAKRIINYRDRLGGYFSLEQLKEVWGMDSASYAVLLNYIYVDAAVSKININNADVSSLGKHPYIGYTLAKLIVNYRLQHGKYNEPKDLFNIHVMNEKIFSKIEPYISTSDD